MKLRWANFLLSSSWPQKKYKLKCTALFQWAALWPLRLLPAGIYSLNRAINQHYIILSLKAEMDLWSEPVGVWWFYWTWTDKLFYLVLTWWPSRRPAELSSWLQYQIKPVFWPWWILISGYLAVTAVMLVKDQVNWTFRLAGTSEPPLIPVWFFIVQLHAEQVDPDVSDFLIVCWYLNQQGFVCLMFLQYSHSVTHHYCRDQKPPPVISIYDCRPTTAESSENSCRYVEMLHEWKQVGVWIL